MINRFFDFQSVLEELYVQINSLSGVTKRQREKLMSAHLSNSDWALLKSLRFVLERFSDATDVISGRSYPTISIVYAVKLSLHHFRNDLTCDIHVRIIKQMLLAPFNRYMALPVNSKETDIINAAALLDPSTDDILEPNDKKAAEKFLILETKRRMKDGLNEHRNTRIIAGADGGEESRRSDSNTINKGGSQIKKLFNKCGINCSTTNTSGKKTLAINQELAKFASIPKDDYDYATFWQENGSSMPNLAVLARKYLAISATSVPSESAFSVSNYVLRKTRLTLTSKNVKFTMFLKGKLN